MRFAETLAEEVRGTGIDVNAIAPGALNTRLLDEVLEAGPERVGEAFYERSVEQQSDGGTPLELPARLALFLASTASDGITGKLISAPWDAWEEFPSRAEDLRGTGGGATSPRPLLSAYAASKAAVVRFAETLAEEVRGTGTDVNAIAPGALNTRLLDEVLAAGPERVGDAFYERALEQQSAGGTPLDLPARLALFLASAESDGITGKLISAPWDPWEQFPSHAEDLRGTDVYTLRRIVPADRGLSWD